MISKEEVRELLKSTETYRIERTTSTGDMDKFQEAICAFSNDLPNSKKNGYLILGAYDNGTLSGLKVDDDLLKKISAIRSNGNILPLPIMSVERFEYEDGDLLVAEVSPSLVPLYDIAVGHLFVLVLAGILPVKRKNEFCLNVELHIWQHLMPLLVLAQP